MTERVTVDLNERIARVTLNRPEKHNAVDRAMFDALIETGTALAADRSIRAIVLHGAGENFCAGIDVSVFQGGEDGIDPSSMQPRDGSPANFFQSAAYVWREQRVPVIAALHGVVFGAGLQIALGADVRFAATKATLSVMEIKWGIIPDMGIATTLPGLMPLDKALELAWTGRTVSGLEAQELGLVTAARDEPLDAAMELARQIAAKSPDAIRAAKALFQEAWGNRDAALLRREAEIANRGDVGSEPERGCDCERAETHTQLRGRTGALDRLLTHGACRSRGGQPQLVERQRSPPHRRGSGDRQLVPAPTGVRPRVSIEGNSVTMVAAIAGLPWYHFGIQFIEPMIALPVMRTSQASMLPSAIPVSSNCSNAALCRRDIPRICSRWSCCSDGISLMMATGPRSPTMMST